MDVFKAIAERFSYRGPYRDEQVPRDDLRRIVEAGLLAPSGKNAQTTRFVIVDDPDLLERIGAIPSANRSLREAKALIACIVDVNPEAIYEGFAFQIEDCAAAVENMLLAVTALDYASVWVDGWLRVEGRAHAIGAMLGVPDGKVIRVLLPVGVPEGERRQPPKMPFEQRAFFNRFGA
ncbi:MAG: nitroreductase [Nitrospiraceae bacterium]|nr:nitroreductase [Nitrospiraceae bacterium]